MQAFFKTGQVQAAERVLEIMSNKSLKPDQYTYGVLLRGYAKAQIVERLGDIVGHVEAEQELDPDMLRALATVVDRQRLMHTLEESRRRKEAEAQERANREAREEHLRWQPPQFEVCDAEAATVAEDQLTAADTVAAKDEVLDSLPNEPTTLTEPPTPPPVAETTQSAYKEEEPLHRRNRPVHTPVSTRLNLQDPEVQYRRLQEQMGLIEPVESQVDVQSPRLERPNSFGAKLKLKSIMEKAGDRQQPEKPTVAKKTPRFNLAKPWKGEGSQ